MNYIAEIKGFHDLIERKEGLSTGQIALWYALMYRNNRCTWQEWFSVSNQTLVIHTGLSRQGIQKARNSLKQLGAIDFKANGTLATSYKMNSLAITEATSNSYQVGCQVGFQDGCQVGCQVGSTLTKPKPKPKLKQDTTPISPNDFAAFWEAYPKKKAKGDAEKAWRGVRAELSVILEAVNRQKRSSDWQKDGGKYIPYPATWLRGKRWEDAEPPEHMPEATSNPFLQMLKEGEFDE